MTHRNILSYTIPNLLHPVDMHVYLKNRFGLLSPIVWSVSIFKLLIITLLLSEGEGVVID